MLATSHNNFLYIGGLPVFYWPVMATSLRKPSYYIERFSVKNDNVFGTQVLADWDLFQLLKVKDPPAGTEWLLSTDYLSERGLGLGTTFEYRAEQFPGASRSRQRAGLMCGGSRIPGWTISGATGGTCIPDTEWRGRVYWRHRHDLAGWLAIHRTAGLISDRNFLEQYFEKEWDEWKDRVTSLELKRSWDGQSLRVLGQVRLNDSVSQTEWFPRLDHFLIGRSLLQDRLTWYAHSQASYARFQILDPPTDPEDADRLDVSALGAAGPDCRKVVGSPRGTNSICRCSWGSSKLVPYVAGRTGSLAGSPGQPKRRLASSSGRRACA